jgi:phosphate starvation-inducible PhoH-like protein
MSNKNKKKCNKKINRFIEEEVEYYEYDTKLKSYYEGYQYLSSKEKMLFENKFSKPRNNSQEKYVKELNKKNNKIIVVTGPAGTGKTLFGTEYAIKEFLLGSCEKLIFTRPTVSVDEDLGYLPGSMEDKMAPWVRPIYDILYNFIHPQEVSKLIEDKSIEICPLGFMRGRTFKNCWIVADEMQNSTPSQLKLLLTRLGDNSRIIITGDLEQIDTIDNINGLDDFLNKFKGRKSNSISSVEFNTNDIERSEVVKEVLNIYKSEILPPNYINDDTSTIRSSDSEDIKPVETFRSHDNISVFLDTNI